MGAGTGPFRARRQRDSVVQDHETPGRFSKLHRRPCRHPARSAYQRLPERTGLGSENSDTPSPAETIEQEAVERPVFDPPMGTYPFDLDVAITCETPVAAIHYTTNGVGADASSAAFSSPIHIGQRGNSQDLGHRRETGDARFFSCPRGLHDRAAGKRCTGNSRRLLKGRSLIHRWTNPFDLDVTITCEMPAAAIHYTTNGVGADASSAAFSSPIHIGRNAATVRIWAIAVKPGMRDSSPVHVDYSIDPEYSVRQAFDAATSTNCGGFLRTPWKGSPELGFPQTRRRWPPNWSRN